MKNARLINLCRHVEINTHIIVHSVVNQQEMQRLLQASVNIVPSHRSVFVLQYCVSACLLRSQEKIMSCQSASASQRSTQGTVWRSYGRGHDLEGPIQAN